MQHLSKHVCQEAILRASQLYIQYIVSVSHLHIRPNCNCVAYCLIHEEEEEEEEFHYVHTASKGL